MQMSTRATEQVDPTDQVNAVESGHGPDDDRSVEPLTVGPSTIRSDLADLARSEMSLRRFLHGLPGVDQVGAEARAASLATRSIKTDAKLWAIDTAISMIDLTTLEGADTARESAFVVRQGGPARPDRPDRPSCSGGVRLSRPRAGGQGRARSQPGQGGVSGHCVPFGPRFVGRKAGRRGRRRHFGGRRSGHGDRPGGLPVRAGTGWCSMRSGR